MTIHTDLYLLNDYERRPVLLAPIAVHLELTQLA